MFYILFSHSFYNTHWVGWLFIVQYIQHSGYCIWEMLNINIIIICINSILQNILYINNVIIKCDCLNSRIAKDADV